MSQENAELVREAYAAYNREGIDGILRFLDPEVEWRNPAESADAGVFIGHQGVREWQHLADQAFEMMQFEPERIDELPDGRTFALSRFRFRAQASDMDAEVAFVHVITWRAGLATKVRMYTSEAEALKAVGLEESAVSQENVEILRQLYARWEQGDFLTPEPFDAEIQFVRTGAPDDMTATTGSWNGLEAMWSALREWLQAWEDVRYTAEEFVLVGDRVLVLSRQRARGKVSGLAYEHEMGDVFVLRKGRIVRWELYWNRADALKAVGLEE